MRLRRLMVAVPLLLTAGCGLFSRSKSTFYSLETIPPAAAVVSSRSMPVGIDVLELPPGTDRREVVVRKADHQLDVRSNQQWSAAFQPLVLHTLAFDLARRLPPGAVVLPGESKPLSMRSIDVVFEELAAGPEKRVVLDARWVLHESGRADLAGHEQLTVDVASLGSADVAAGVSQALAALADRIAAKL